MVFTCPDEPRAVIACGIISIDNDAVYTVYQSSCDISIVSDVLIIWTFDSLAACLPCIEIYFYIVMKVACHP